MALAQRVGNDYINVHIEGGGRAILGNVFGQSSDERALAAILDSLRHDGMTDRRDTLAEAQEGTFDWTFLEGETKFLTRRWIDYTGVSHGYFQDVQMSFKAWLEADDEGLFCVMGKPGSGKSTFMKSLATYLDLNRMLQAWTKGERLLRGDHYFWILGGYVQKSIEGLLRAVLHALLSGLSQCGASENLETIQHVCGSRWQSTDKGRAWNCRELKDMLSRLAQTSNAKVFLLIDALDERDPQDRLGDLADVILWLSRLPNVKLCVSCRPWAPFTRCFDKATILHLDQLTYHAMEIYIEKRLLCAEKEADICSDFCEGALPTRSLIYDVASAANGVFLWVELVVKSLCSEIRTGCSVDQLRLVISELPTDIDDYFQNLIFGRIGTTRPNVTKTAAALKLAMITHSQNVKMVKAGCDVLPMADDYLNFWLLSVGQLKPGFSWTDPLDPRYSAFDTERKFRQTKAFLEETCNDLLVIHNHDESYNIEFLHRTVFDFCARIPLAFPLRSMHLAIFLMRASLWTSSSCVAFVACKRRAWTTRCTCLGLFHLCEMDLVKHCASLGLHRYPFETAQDMPHEALSSNDGYDHLTLALLKLEKPGTRKATAIRLLRQALWCGCDPNASFNQNRPENSCRQSKWERWLHAQYLYSQQHRRVARGDGAHQSSGATKDIDCQRNQENVSIIELLLRHGADPNCTLCTTDHQSARGCLPTALHDILQFIVPAECVSTLQALLIACSSDDRRYALRRNQRKRAIRSYIISEQRFASRVTYGCPQELQANERWIWAGSHRRSWQFHQRDFLQGLMKPDYDEAEQKICNESHESPTNPGLLTWCLDCEIRSYACLSHSRSHSLAKDAPCTNLLNLRIAKPEGHMTVAILVEICCGRLCWGLCHNDSAKLNAAYQYLGCEPCELDLTDQAAISVLKEWNAKDPIEPDSLQGDDLQDVTLPQELDVAALKIGGPNIYETSIAEFESGLGLFALLGSLRHLEAGG